MTPPSDEPDQDYDVPERRSIFAALWFRVVLVLGVVGVVAALAMPYLLDWLNPPPERRSTTATKPAPPPAVKPSAQAQPPQMPQGAPRPTPSVAPPARTKPEAAPPKATAEPEPAATGQSKKASAGATTPREGRRPARAAAPKAVASGSGSYWVQVGAFRDAERAKKLVAQLRGQEFTAIESVTRSGAEAPAAASSGTPAATAGDRYDVLVSGASTSDINAKLAAKGLAAEPAGNGVVIKPSLPLRDAVALSKDLAVEGLKVQVKRAGSGGTEAASAPTAAGAESLHRVRVGAFPDRKAAAAALRELEAKGYKGFIARGE